MAQKYPTYLWFGHICPNFGSFFGSLSLDIVILLYVVCIAILFSVMDIVNLLSLLDIVRLLSLLDILILLSELVIILVTNICCQGYAVSAHYKYIIYTLQYNTTYYYTRFTFFVQVKQNKYVEPIFSTVGNEITYCGIWWSMYQMPNNCFNLAHHQAKEQVTLSRAKLEFQVKFFLILQLDWKY